jgi:hypothetical protein
MRTASLTSKTPAEGAPAATNPVARISNYSIYKTHDSTPRELGQPQKKQSFEASFSETPATD